jgi:hypothetical protein
LLTLPLASKLLNASGRRLCHARDEGVWAISQKPLREFWADHPEVEDDLKAWYKTVEKAEWKNFGEVRATYAKVSIVVSVRQKPFLRDRLSWCLFS